MESQFYVYILYDCRTEKPFYVGKGQGSRIDQHESDDDPNVEKRETVQLLKSAGFLGKRVVGRYQTEDEALAVEATLIKWMYGLRNLTNQRHGRRHELIRSIGNFREMQGIDVERKTKLQDGSYTEKQRKQIQQNNVIEKLEFVAEVALVTVASMELDDVDISDPDVSYAQDPQVRISHPTWPATVRLKVQLHGRSVAPAFVALSARKDDRPAMQRFANHLNRKLRDGTKPYVGLWDIDDMDPRSITCPSIDDEPQISACIERMCRLIAEYQP